MFEKRTKFFLDLQPFPCQLLQERRKKFANLSMIMHKMCIIIIIYQIVLLCEILTALPVKMLKDQGGVKSQVGSGT